MTSGEQVRKQEIYLGGWSNKNGTFLLYTKDGNHGPRYYLKKYTHGKPSFFACRITRHAAEEILAADNHRKAWALCNYELSLFFLKKAGREDDEQSLH